jgi:hypothetical protein
MGRTLVGRMILVLGGLFALGIALRLLMAIYEPILGKGLMGGLGSGLQMIFDIVGPAVPAIAAVIIVGGLIWIIVGYSRSRRF